MNCRLLDVAIPLTPALSPGMASLPDIRLVQFGQAVLHLLAPDSRPLTPGLKFGVWRLEFSTASFQRLSYNPRRLSHLVNAHERIHLRQQLRQVIPKSL